jgi:hypothetical protein
LVKTLEMMERFCFVIFAVVINEEEEDEPRALKISLIL